MKPNNAQPPVNLGSGGASKRRGRSSGKTESILAKMPSMKTTGKAADKGMLSKLGNMSKKQGGMLAAACAALVALPLAVSTMMDDAGQNSRRLSPGFSTRENPSENLYDPSVTGYAPGSSMGGDGSGITPLSAFDPLSLINTGDEEAVMAQPVSAPVDTAHNDEDDYRNTIRQNTGRPAEDAIRASAGMSKEAEFSVKYRPNKGSFSLAEGGGSSNTRYSKRDSNVLNSAKQLSGSGLKGSVAPVAPKEFRGVVSGGNSHMRSSKDENLAARASKMASFMQGQNSVQALEKAASDKLQAGMDNLKPVAPSNIQAKYNVNPASNRFGDGRDSYEDWLKKLKETEKAALRKQLRDLGLGLLNPLIAYGGNMLTSKASGMFEQDVYCVDLTPIAESTDGRSIHKKLDVMLKDAPGVYDGTKSFVVSTDLRYKVLADESKDDKLMHYAIEKYGGKTSAKLQEATMTCKESDKQKLMGKKALSDFIKNYGGENTPAAQNIAKEIEEIDKQVKAAIDALKYDPSTGVYDPNGVQSLADLIGKSDAAVKRIVLGMSRDLKIVDIDSSVAMVGAHHKVDAKYMSVLDGSFAKNQDPNGGRQDYLKEILDIRVGAFPMGEKALTDICLYKEVVSLFNYSATGYKEKGAILPAVSEIKCYRFDSSLSDYKTAMTESETGLEKSVKDLKNENGVVLTPEYTKAYDLYANYEDRGISSEYLLGTLQKRFPSVSGQESSAKAKDELYEDIWKKYTYGLYLAFLKDSKIVSDMNTAIEKYNSNLKYLKATFDALEKIPTQEDKDRAKSEATEKAVGDALPKEDVTTPVVDPNTRPDGVPTDAKPVYGPDGAISYQKETLKITIDQSNQSTAGSSNVTMYSNRKDIRAFCNGKPSNTPVNYAYSSSTIKTCGDVEGYFARVDQQKLQDQISNAKAKQIAVEHNKKGTTSSASGGSCKIMIEYGKEIWKCPGN